VPERTWIDDDLRRAHAALLSHEMFHSWNGKYRRPADMATPDYQTPMRTQLLWVYEGLTEYYGWALAGRSGLHTQQEARDDLALTAAYIDRRVGRAWRPLKDTAVAAQLLYEAPPQWASLRRGTDFYDEGTLIWLEADVTIRRLTHDQRSLDDFCRQFHGAPSGPPRVVPFTLDDIVHTLNEVVPYDWKGFFEARVSRTAEHAPLRGLEESGWRLVFGDSVTDIEAAYESDNKRLDLRYSLGVTLGSEEGDFRDVIPGLPAAKAGIAPGMKLVAVNGRAWTKDILRSALKATKVGAPLELLVVNDEFYSTHKVDYRGGEKNPTLVRDPSKPDVLSEILKPHAVGAAPLPGQGR
jgi:predicted metalloprotease with PDZ domain